MVSIALKLDGTMGFLKQGDFRGASEFCNGLWVYMDVIPFEDGVAASIGGGGPKCDGIGAGLVDFKSGRFQQRGVRQCAVFAQNHPGVFTIQVGGRGQVCGAYHQWSAAGGVGEGKVRIGIG